MPLNTEQCYSCWRCQKCIQGPHYRAMLLISDVSKVHTGLSIQSNIIHVEGVKSSSIYTISAVKICLTSVTHAKPKEKNKICHSISTRAVKCDGVFFILQHGFQYGFQHT